MKQYKHYSFDLWGTLLKPNPSFAEARAEYFFDHFNRQKKSHHEIHDIFYKVSQMHNVTAEVTGLGFTPQEMYTLVLHLMEYDTTRLELRDIHSIYLQMENLFLKNTPLLFADTGKVLDTIKRSGATLSILSNTGYAGADTMRRVLEKLDILKYFSFTMFSDEAGCSKPSSALYAHMLSKIANIRMLYPVSKDDILHVGDSVKADINGANAAGITGYGVHFNNITLKNLIEW